MLTKESGESTLSEIQRLKNMIIKIKRVFLLKQYEFEGKIRYPFIVFFNKVIRLLEMSIVSIIILTVLQQLKVIHFKWLANILDKVPTISDDLNRQLVFSQISVTFIILSLFSLITNLKKEKVLGTSIYKIAFAKSILGNIVFISFSIFIFLSINITLYIKNNSSDTILLVFLFTLFLLTWLIIKIILYSNSQNLSMNKIFSLYYLENKKLIRKPKSTWGSRNRFSEHLYNLNEDTIEKIYRKDIEYRRNFHVYKSIADLSLFNYKRTVQENYTENIYQPDIIAMWTSAIEELIRNQLYSDSIIQYNRMIELFTSHEIYLSSSRINRLLEQIFVSISVTESKVVFEQNKRLLLTSMMLTMKYGDYRLNNDFSYTRLGKTKDRFYLQPLYSEFMINYYNLIDKDMGFTDSEKSNKLYEYFHSLRMMAFDVLKFRSKEIKFFEVNREIQDYSQELSLVGIPLSRLLLLIIQEKRRSRLLYFLNNYKNKSIHLACLIVASKLTTLYFEIKNSDPTHKRIIEDYLILILSKLIELERPTIKYYCYTLKNSVNIHQDNIYGIAFLTRENGEFLDIIKQTIMIKKQRINIENKLFSNYKLDELVKLFYAGYHSNLLKKAQEEENKNYDDKFGVLTRLM